MDQKLTPAQFHSQFSSNDVCLEALVRYRYPKGIYCKLCREITKHYKLQNRTSYSCKFCRNQIYPLKGTIFEKTSTPLHLWFYAIFLMTHTRATMSAKQLQRELGVTYKTAWRMYTLLKSLMQQNNGDLLMDTIKGDERVRKWIFFNKLEFRVVQK